MNGVEIHSKIFDDLNSKYKESNIYRLLLSDLIELDDNTIISTSEHVAPFNTVGTISFIYPQLFLQQIDVLRKTKIIILAGSLIPLDNADYPRGFFLPGNTKVKKINIFSQKFLKKSPLLLNPVTDFQGDSYIFNIFPFVKNSFSLKHETYAHQMCNVMEKIAENWFPSVPPIHVYPLEEIAAKILIKLLEEEDDKIICSILFDLKIRNKILESLYNIFCAWGNKKGSVLFWSIKGNGKVLPFDITPNENLLERNGEFSLTLEKNSILEHLKNGNILPGVYLALLVVSYLPMVPIVGGRKQVYYYKHMITATNKALGECRSTNLSVFGYEKIKLIEDEYMTKYGTGLNLTTTQPDLDYYYEVLNNSLTNIPLDVYYD